MGPITDMHIFDKLAVSNNVYGTQSSTEYEGDDGVPLV